MQPNLHNDAMMDRLQRAKKLAERRKPKWPERHLIGIDEVSPVPFHGAQDMVWDSNRRIVAYLAGAQSGKTSLAPWWLEREIRARGSGDYLAVTASFDLFKAKFLREMLKVFEQILKSGRYWAGDKIIELADPETGKFWADKSTDAMWGRIILRSAQSTGGLESSTAKAAILDEAGQDGFGIEAYRAIRRRLMLNRGRMLITSTLFNLGWIISEIINPAVKSGTTKTITLENGAEVDLTDSEVANTTLIQADSIANPVFPKDEYDLAKATLPAYMFAMQFRGRVGRPSHMIYDVFDEEKHLCPRFTIPPEWPRYLGLDFGGANTHALYLAVEPGTHRIYVYREYHAGKRTAKEHTEDILFGEPGIPTCYGGARAEGQWRMEFRDAGLPIREPKISDVWLGINRVYGLLKEGIKGECPIRVQIFDDLDNIRNELNSYHRKTDEQGNPVDDEIVAKSVYHGNDCFRYVAGSMPLNQKALLALV